VEQATLGKLYAEPSSTSFP